MRIIAQQSHIDLRFVVARSVYLRRVAKEFNLRNGQSVCFTNRAQTRFRLILMINNALFMCIPEIDSESKLSIFLKISEELARLADVNPRLEFRKMAENTRNRIKEARARSRT